MGTSENNTPAKTAPSRATALSDWDRLSKIFTNLSSVRVRSNWFTTGMSSRIGPQRVQALLKDKRTHALDAIIKRNSADDIARLISIARVNHEQAQAAFRITILLNVTIIIGGLLLSNQIVPGWIVNIVNGEDRGMRAGLLTFLISIPFVAGSIATYSWGGVASARDLLHLLELRLSGMEDGRLDTYAVGARQLTDGDMVSDLRSVQLSDI